MTEISDLEVSNVLETTIETMWNNIKGEKRPSWIKTIVDITNEKHWNKDQLESAIQLFCRKYSSRMNEEDGKWTPKLAVIIKFLDRHVIGTSTETDVFAAWHRIPSCEKCYNGFVGYIDWEQYKDPVRRYRCYAAFCDCPKGSQSPYKAEPMKRMSYQELLDKINSGAKYTLVTREDMIPVADQSTLPKHDEIVKEIENQFAEICGIPF